MRPLVLLALVALLALSLPSTAQTPGACALGTAEGDLATPDLLARVFNSGSLFFGGTTTNGDGYLVPRAANRSPLFAAGLWVAGRVDGEVRAAGSRYANFSFWPGPLDAGAALPNASDCSAFDRIYVVSPADVAAYEATGTATADLAAWPVGLGARAVDAGGQPVVASTREQVVNLAAGERPVLHGGPTAFWVMNDVGGPHTVLNTPPLGIEVRVTASAPRVPATLRQSTIYRYEIVNRNTVPLEDLHVGFFADPDLGNAVDDFVGVDTTRALAYVYNADDDDQGSTGYGAAPPAFGYDLLGGLWAGGSTYDDGWPSTGAQMDNYLRGLWSDGTPIRENGSGYMQPDTFPVTRYVYPGDPVEGTFWSERRSTAAGSVNAPGDRQYGTSAPAVTLAPGESHTVDLAMLFAQGDDHLESVAALRRLSDVTQPRYEGGWLFGATAAPPAAVGVPTPLEPADGAVITSDVTLTWTADPDADHYVVETSGSPGFEVIWTLISSAPSVTIPFRRLPQNSASPLYWRVRALRDGLEGSASAVRSLRPQRYVPGALRLASGAPAFVETTAPGGAPACDGPGDPDEGCAEVGGDLVAASDNSTADYQLIIGSGTDPALGTATPAEIEIRFTPAGSIGLRPVAGTFRRIYRLPFEVWDIGPVTPGQPNDPSDDRQMIALYSGGIAPEFCTAAYNTTGTTWLIGAAYAVGDDYAAFEAEALAIIASAPDGCPTSIAAAPAYAFVDQVREQPLAGVSVRQVSNVPLDGLTGATIRFYTADPFVDGETAPAEAALALAPPRPNPAAGRVTLPYRIAAAGHVRLTVVDALGRTVATLADGAAAAGEHTASLDARRLAPGVYAVVLDADGRRAVRRLTVTR